MKDFLNKNLKKILITLCVVLVCVFGYSAYRIYSTLKGYREAEETYTEITQSVVTVVAGVSAVLTVSVE